MVQLQISQTGISLEDSLEALSPADVNEQVVCLVLSLVGEKKKAAWQIDLSPRLEEFN